MLKGIITVWLAILFAGCSTLPERGGLAQTRLQLGLAYLALDDLTAARRNLQQAMRLAPADYRVKLAMARYEQQANNPQNAARSYQAAFRLSPRNTDVLNNYGAFLCSLGQYEAAQRYFAQAAELSINHQRADVAENAGYCYLAAGNWSQASLALGQAVRQNPGKRLVLLVEAEKRIDSGEQGASRLLLDVYQHHFAASAQSLWLEIRFAALVQQPEGIASAGDALARNFPQSRQHLHFLANEY